MINAIQPGKSAALPTLGYHGDAIARGKVKSRLPLVPDDPRFHIVAEAIKTKKFSFHPSLLTGHSVMVENDKGKKYLVNVKSAARRLHLKPEEVREIAGARGLKGLMRRAEKLSRIFKDLEANQVPVNEQIKLLSFIKFLKEEDDGFSIKTKLNESKYLVNKNIKGSVDLFRFNQKLGEGASGVVHGVVEVSEESSDEVAMKVIKGNNEDPEKMARAEEDAENEYRLLTFIHKNGKVPGTQSAPRKFFKVFDAKTKKMKASYITDKYVGGEYLDQIPKLFGAIARKEKSREEMYFQFYQLLAGLKHNHGLGVMHGDIKPENILVHTNSKGIQMVDLSDFGGATLDVNRRRDRCTYTPFYCSADDFKQPNDDEQYRTVEQKRDVFSMGVVLYLALTNLEAPYEYREGFLDTKSDYKELNDPKISHEIKEIVEGMLLPNMDQRLTASEAFEKLNNFVEQNHPNILVKYMDLIQQDDATLFPQEEAALP